MTVTNIAQYISDALAVALILRLLLLRLHTVYRVFCAFLVLDLLSSLVFFLEKLFYRPGMDYRVTWMIIRPLAWALSLWMVYALLDAMLAKLQGILRLSRKILNIAFAAALLGAFLTARPEYLASGLASSPDPVNRALAIMLVLQRVIFLAALLVLLAIIAFILWFPVEMPRNLAVFSFGFVVFFSIGTVVFLLHTYWPPAGPRVFDIASFALAACYAYWLLFINRAGETLPVLMGHSWEPGQQQRMIAELEAMNAALVRPSRR
jgi:hypothetical protein